MATALLAWLWLDGRTATGKTATAAAAAAAGGPSDAERVRRLPEPEDTGAAAACPPPVAAAARIGDGAVGSMGNETQVVLAGVRDEVGLEVVKSADTSVLVSSDADKDKRCDAREENDE